MWSLWVQGNQVKLDGLEGMGSLEIGDSGLGGKVWVFISHFLFLLLFYLVVLWSLLMGVGDFSLCERLYVSEIFPFFCS